MKFANGNNSNVTRTKDIADLLLGHGKFDVAAEFERAWLGDRLERFIVDIDNERLQAHNEAIEQHKRIDKLTNDLDALKRVLELVSGTEQVKTAALAVERDHTIAQLTSDLTDACNEIARLTAIKSDARVATLEARLKEANKTIELYSTNNADLGARIRELTTVSATDFKFDADDAKLVAVSAARRAQPPYFSEPFSPHSWVIDAVMRSFHIGMQRGVFVANGAKSVDVTIEPTKVAGKTAVDLARELGKEQESEARDRTHAEMEQNVIAPAPIVKANALTPPPGAVKHHDSKHPTNLLADVIRRARLAFAQEDGEGDMDQFIAERVMNYMLSTINIAKGRTGEAPIDLKDVQPRK